VGWHLAVLVKRISFQIKKNENENGT
jgi:hypothetical protein